MSPKDVSRLWPNCRPEDIKVLTVDGSQVCEVGAHAYLPKVDVADEAEDQESHMDVDAPKMDRDDDITMKDLCGAITSLVLAQASVTTTAPVAKKAVYHNLAAKQKAVSQPTAKFRQWTEHQKNIKNIVNIDNPDEPTSISALECGLPALHGDGSSVISYVKELEKVEEQLDAFYNGKNMRYKRHKWDATWARNSEYIALASRLLKVVGGNIGQQREDTNKVVIAVGLGQFSARTGLSSLHESFLSFFVQKARSLGYIVVGVNEYYTSKKCPTCEQFVGEVNYRRLYCTGCKT
ncbi:hypothetical protein BGX28_001724, partial [Mortierella sp. GBA30]